MSLSGRRMFATARFALLFLGLVALLAACNKSEKESYRVFASPDDAGNGLLQAVKSGNSDELLAIFGPDSKELLFSGDAVQDRATADSFLAGYGVMHRWREMPDGTQVLLVGADNFAFPIPLKKNDGGRWFFDTAVGKDEILSRRIGRNELAVIGVCEALADAQADYFSQSHDNGSTKQYALKFISDTGKQNGLYWQSGAGQPKSPLGPMVAFATSEGYSVKADSHIPFHGYYFRILDRQGSRAPSGAKDYVVDGKMVNGFAFVAYPAEYGNSGIMTFVINQDGLFLQKDLGKNTAEIASAMTEFNPEANWTLVQD